MVTGFDISKVDIAECLEVDARRARAAEEPSSIGYVSGEGSDSCGVVKNDPCLVFFRVCKVDVSKGMGLKEAMPVGRDPEAG